MFMWPLSTATSLGVFCRMETKQHPVNTADEKRFILTDFWGSVALLAGLFCLQSFIMQMEREDLAFLTMWSNNNLQFSLSPAYHVQCQQAADLLLVLNIKVTCKSKETCSYIACL